MNKKIAVVFIFVLTLFSVKVFSQSPVPTQTFPPVSRPVASQDSPPALRDGTNKGLPEFFKIGDITGNIGGAKAIYLAKPIYLDQAKEAGAEGKVKVEIAIDEDGNVILAKAVSGHHSLHESAQNAALKSKFRVPQINGQGSKVSGHLNYNFFIETPNWFTVAYGLSVINAGILQTSVIKKAFQSDWKEENELINQLEKIKPTERKDIKPLIISQTVENSGNEMRATQHIEGRINILLPNYEAVKISQNLISSLQKRLANDEKSLWQFNLGVGLINIFHLYRNPNERQNAALTLRQFAQNAPPSLSSEVIIELQKLITIFEKGTRTMETDHEIRKSLAVFAQSK